jgi:hypothetical protein
MTNNSTSASVTTSTIPHNSKGHEELVTITEKINLTKSQYEVLNIICNTYEESVSQYLQEALVEAMRFDIEEGNFSDVLLQKITDKKEEEKSKNSLNREKSRSPFLTGSSVDNGVSPDLQF